MRLSHFLLIASAVLLLTVLASFFLSPVSRPAADAHADYPSMERTVVGSEPTLWLGYAMALAILATMGISVVMGVVRNGRSGHLGRWLTAGFVCLGLIFTALVFSYDRYASESGTELFAGLPPPTAWMMYAAWLFPLFLILACMRHFDWYLSEEDERRFEELMRAVRDREGDS